VGRRKAPNSTTTGSLGEKGGGEKSGPFRSHLERRSRSAEESFGEALTGGGRETRSRKAERGMEATAREAGD
jgi:hypothetical protein